MFKVGILSIICINLLAAFADNLHIAITTLSTPVATLQRSTAEDRIAKSDGLSKRDIKPTDLSSANTIGIAAKNNDPLPEFYRGPGSTGHHTSTQVPSYYSNFKPYNGFKSRPVAFPDAYSANNNNYNTYNKQEAGGGGGGDGDGGSGSGGHYDNSNVQLANSYNSWHHLKGKVGALANKKDALQDRISVATGHYSTAEHGSGASGGGYGYEGRPYGGHAAAHQADYLASNGHFSSSGATSAHPAGYYGVSAAAEGIPFDVYGAKTHYSAGSAGNDYAAYPYPDLQEPVAYKPHPDVSHKALLAKSFLIPLASAAVLGIAAALVTNPLLLQLGTVSGVAPAAAVYGKRKRRDLTTSAISQGNSTNTLNLAFTSVDKNKKDSNLLLPYRDHHQQQNPQRHRHIVRA